MKNANIKPGFFEDVTSCQKKPKCLKRHWTSLLIILATVLGFVSGLLLRQLDPEDETVKLIGYPGMLVLRAFRMIILPLLPCSIVLGITSLGKSKNGKLVSCTVFFFVTLSLLATALGATLGHLLKPGLKAVRNSESLETHSVGRKGQILNSVLDMLRNAIPDNIVVATFKQEYTSIYAVANKENTSHYNGTQQLHENVELKNGTNFIGLLVMSVVLAIAMASLGDQTAQLRSLIEEINAVVMKIVYYLVRILPLGMFFWMCQEGIKTQSVLSLFYQVGWLLLTEVSGLLIFQLLVMPLLYLALIRRNPFSFIFSILPTFLTAFGTGSSLATLPVTLRCMEEKNKMSRQVSRFVLPLGMVINMHGVCLDLTIVTLFLAQMERISVDITSTVILCLTVVMLAIASPAMPATGSPLFVLTCLAVVNVESSSNISLVLAIFWLTDRISTIGNSVGDCYVAAFVAKLCGEADEKEKTLHTVTIDKNSIYPAPAILITENEMHTVKL